MQYWLHSLGLKEQEFPSDGNCLFSAIADQLGGDHTRYRAQAVAHMQQSPDFYKQFVPQKTAPHFDVYLSGMARRGTRGSETEIIVLSELLNITIEVYWRMDLRQFNYGGRSVVRLVCHGNNHYGSLRQMIKHEEQKYEDKLIYEEDPETQSTVSDSEESFNTISLRIFPRRIHDDETLTKMLEQQRPSICLIESRRGFTSLLARFQSNFFLIKLTFTTSITKPHTNGHTTLTQQTVCSGVRNSLYGASVPGGKILYIGCSTDAKQTQPLLLYSAQGLTKLKKQHIQRREYHTVIASKTVGYIVCGQTDDFPILTVDLKSYNMRVLRLNQQEMSLPKIDMHTSHIHNNQIIIVGGRTHTQAQGIVFSESMFAVDIVTGKVSIFGSLPSAVAGHVSFLVDDRYIVILGGTDGFTISSDKIWRYDISTASWSYMVKFQEGLNQEELCDRINSASYQVDNEWGIIYGGLNRREGLQADFCILPFSMIRKDVNFKPFL